MKHSTSDADIWKKKIKKTQNMIENVGNKIEENCKTKSINIKA